jgi:pimeloyl-ACP methyl ester carboxylesterase
MPTPIPSWSPPLPKVSGFDHFVVETPGLRTHVAAIGDGEPVVLLHGFPQHWWVRSRSPSQTRPDDSPAAFPRRSPRPSSTYAARSG